MVVTMPNLGRLVVTPGGRQTCLLFSSTVRTLLFPPASSCFLFYI